MLRGLSGRHARGARTLLASSREILRQPRQRRQFQQRAAGRSRIPSQRMGLLRQRRGKHPNPTGKPAEPHGFPLPHQFLPCPCRMAVRASQPQDHQFAQVSLQLRDVLQRRIFGRQRHFARDRFVARAGLTLDPRLQGHSGLGAGSRSKSRKTSAIPTRYT